VKDEEIRGEVTKISREANGPGWFFDVFPVYEFE
jgi:hypothetical protein